MDRVMSASHHMKGLGGSNRLRVSFTDLFRVLASAMCASSGSTAAENVRHAGGLRRGLGARRPGPAAGQYKPQVVDSVHARSGRTW